MDKPDPFLLSRVQWDLFVSLSWRVEPSQDRARKYWFMLVRQIAEWSGLHFGDVLWLLRFELGETTGRGHYHALVGGLPHHVLYERLCKVIEQAWLHFRPLVTAYYRENGKRKKEQVSKYCGLADVRIYDPVLNALDYSCPSGQEGGLYSDSSVNGANRYEANKFGGAAWVEYSLSLIRALDCAGRPGLDGRFVPTAFQAVQKPVGCAGSAGLEGVLVRGREGSGCGALAITESVRSSSDVQVLTPALAGAVNARWRESSPGLWTPAN